MTRVGLVKRQKVAGRKIERAKQLRATMTPAEGALWASLRGNQLSGLHFRRQQIIDGFLADFYCHSAGVVLEIDGPIHGQQVDYDRERDRVIAAHDLQVLRVRNDEVMSDIQAVLKRIESVCIVRRTQIERTELK